MPHTRVLSTKSPHDNEANATYTEKHDNEANATYTENSVFRKGISYSVEQMLVGGNKSPQDAKEATSMHD